MSHEQARRWLSDVGEGFCMVLKIIELAGRREALHSPAHLSEALEGMAGNSERTESIVYATMHSEE